MTRSIIFYSLCILTVALSEFMFEDTLREVVNFENYRPKEFVTKHTFHHGIFDICAGTLEKSYMGCLLSSKHMNNILIYNKKIVIHENPYNMPSRKLKQQYTTGEGLVVERRLGVLPRGICKSYYNGTLYITGKEAQSSALKDPFVFLSQILLDSLISPEYVKLPRVELSLTKIQNQLQDKSQKEVKEKKGLFQIPLYNELKLNLTLPNREDGSPPSLLLDGEIHIDDAEGMCFRRVIWGSGTKLLNADTMVVLRRLTSDLARALFTKQYDISVPSVFAFEESQFSMEKLTRAGYPLRVIIVTKETKGRTCGSTSCSEDIIRAKLVSEGAVVHILYNDDINIDTNRDTKLVEKLGYFLNADAIVAMPDADLKYAIFAPRNPIIVDLKSTKGYKFETGLHISDARDGFYVHIDARNIVVEDSGNAPKTSERIYNGIVIANQLYNEEVKLEGNIVRISEDTDDFVIGPSVEVGELSRLLGPQFSALQSNCMNMTIYPQYRRDVLNVNTADYCRLNSLLKYTSKV